MRGTKNNHEIGSDIVPFHKILQWLTYSILEPLESVGILFNNAVGDQIFSKF